MQSRQFDQWVEDGRLWTCDYYDYFVAVPAALGELTNNGTAGSTAQANITIQADADFEWMWATYYASATNPPTYPYTDAQMVPITLQIKDGGSGRDLFSAPIWISQIGGVGRQPYVLPVKRKFMAKSTVNFFFANMDTVNDWFNVSYTLHGQKIFDLGPAPQNWRGPVKVLGQWQ
jgi:hypothetical protein